MKELRVGKLLIRRKAILLIAFVLFVLGMSIGASVAMKEFNAALFIAPILTLLLVSKQTRANIETVK
ncbi:hypothetical protein HX017_01740 [Myroides marinus]|uniref:Uncharacterized protein n=1 Tax=Myroides marinus TaxID=703342 RepID=A0A163WNI2_9FLAO|nr:hypothetical protein [Myroides marinus]KUF39404.1 hypothetical protein AS361_02150 [Myroides marinus]KZE76596.1 hypothetical protein AV926_15755 [Myroides marinus]MDM1345844.1 hypothetical protein [Myroides marinus]MDM1349295.1 hypothetical protein [Myroides marinus]MDM1353027.1 hypothetical protein [Myroides marinus]